jgi:uncharacterized protein
MRRHARHIAAIIFLLLPAICAAEIRFPELTGRVVDNANLINAQLEATLTAQLVEHENATSNQIVVVTLPDLQGYTIEEYGYQLGRHWAIGQKDKNNGVLLIVAKQERKVRIEVGYGLEGTLTDALAANIIHTVILPEFKRGNFEAGVSGGVTAIIGVLSGEYASPRERNQKAISPLLVMFIFGFLLLGILLPALLAGGSRGYQNRYDGFGGGFGGGFGRGGGGGFSGGGGSFGGGGASGGW